MNRPLQTMNLDGTGFALSKQWNGVDGQQRLLYIQKLDVVVILSPSYPSGFAIYDFGRTQTSGNIPRPPVSGTIPAGLGYNGEWVPSLGAVVTWNGGTGFDLLTPPIGDPATGVWTWSRLESSPSNAVVPDSPTAWGTYGRFFFSPQLNCLGVVTGVDKQLNVFALP